MWVDFKGGSNVVKRVAGIIPVLSIAFFAPSSARAAISLGTSVLTENFDELGAAGGVALPSSWKWSHSGSVRSVDTYSSARTTLDSAANAGDSLGAGIYNLGAGPDAVKTLDRSVGMILTDSGSAAFKSCTIYAQFQSSTAVTSFAFQYDLKSFASGLGSVGFQVQTYFSTGSNALSGLGSDFDKTFTAVPASLQTFSATYTPSAPIAAGTVFTLAFCYSASSGSTSASGPTIGFDNFAISTNGLGLTPEPATLTMIGGMMFLGLRRRRA